MSFLKNKKLTKDVLATLPYSARPMFLEGHWKRPRLSKRNLKTLKKASFLHGLDWPMPEPTKEYEKHGFIKNFKRSVEDREHNSRVFKIAESLKGMQTKIEKMREESKLARFMDVFDLPGWVDDTAENESATGARGGSSIMKGLAMKKKDAAKDKKKKK
jgi:hypothetical protein